MKKQQTHSNNCLPRCWECDVIYRTSRKKEYAAPRLLANVGVCTPESKLFPEHTMSHSDEEMRRACEGRVAGSRRGNVS
ncbi:hypothetical protein EYF80_018272 [Liparis tanakae]|uniref:Uncharacterized protein n=1 Tax=Liparis tanakae TaxID=230148 RepID=A0A4Z2I0L7_9TELE|nr:hypothetical protein EYF80_018272 [Liparis tanakae]